MTTRRIAGWALLSLIPITFVAVAALAGQLAELAIAVAVTAFICGAAWAGIHLVETGGRR